MKVPIENKRFLKAYKQFSDDIFRYCLYKTRDRDLALDITQETFTKTWEYLVEGREIKNIRAFLYKVAYHLIVDGSRKKKSFSLDELSEQGVDFGEDKSANLINKFDGEKILEILDKIDIKYREIVIMRYVEDFSIKEISKIINETENNVSVRIHRGLEKLKKILNDHENNRRKI